MKTNSWREFCAKFQTLDERIKENEKQAYTTRYCDTKEHYRLLQVCWGLVFHLTSSDLFIPWYLWIAVVHLFLLRVRVIPTLLPSSSLLCLPQYIFSWSLHSLISLTNSSQSSILITFPHLNLAFLIFFAMSTTSHIFWSLHSIRSQLIPTLLLKGFRTVNLAFSS